MIKRAIIFLIGVGLIICVIYLGILTSKNNSYLIWFGIASAILSPLGLSLIGYALRSDDRKILRQLSQVPEIENLVNEAKSKEEKIKLLEKERTQLVNIVQFEAHKQMLVFRQKSLENDAGRIIKELEAIEKELSNSEIPFESTLAKDEISKLHKRLQARIRGDMVVRLGFTYFTIDRRFLKLNIFGFSLGDFVTSSFDLTEKLIENKDDLIEIKLLDR